MKITSVVAKTEDGTVQINFTIPQEIVEIEEEKAIKELVKDMTIPGFRKGNAPIDIAKEKIDHRKVTEKALNNILPQAFSDAVIENKLHPAIYPKFEILSEDHDKPWQVTAITCELPEIVLGDYKKLIKAALKKDMKKEEKQDKAIGILLETTKVVVPRVLIEEEVNGRLAALLSRLEKLGLPLEGYLSSLGKKVEDLKKEYEEDSVKSIKIELILNKIADIDKVEIDNAEIEKLKDLSATTNSQTVRQVLRKRAVLDSLASLG